MPNNFSPMSRYYGIGTSEMETPCGKMIVYLQRRFVPSPERFSLLLEHKVKELDRLDRITATHLGDAEQYWRVCDANGATIPDELTAKIGRPLKITLPEGIPGFPNA
jgi:hypothetical protein